GHTRHTAAAGAPAGPQLAPDRKVRGGTRRADLAANRPSEADLPETGAELRGPPIRRGEHVAFSADRILGGPGPTNRAHEKQRGHGAAKGEQADPEVRLELTEAAPPLGWRQRFLE